MNDDRYRVSLTADGDVTYEIKFGSVLRPGEIRETQPAGLADGRLGGTATVSAGESHVWYAEGPIRLRHLDGSGKLSVDTATRGSTTVLPGEILRTSCPCNRRRTVALGVAAGGVAAFLAGKAGLAD